MTKANSNNTIMQLYRILSEHMPPRNRRSSHRTSGSQSAVTRKRRSIGRGRLATATGLRNASSVRHRKTVRKCYSKFASRDGARACLKLPSRSTSGGLLAGNTREKNFTPIWRSRRCAMTFAVLRVDPLKAASHTPKD